MTTQGEEPVEGATEEFRDSALDQDHVADAFEAMEAAPQGGALLEGETADRTRDDADDAAADDDADDADEDAAAHDGRDGSDPVGAADSGADVASGGGEGRREPTSGAVDDQGGEDGDGTTDR